MANMNAEAVQFEIDRLQECCEQYRVEIAALRRELQDKRAIIASQLIIIGRLRQRVRPEQDSDG